MTSKILPLAQRPAWLSLEAHYKQIKNVHLRQFFADDPQRDTRFTIGDVGFYFDYSKNRITEETIRLLLELADESAANGGLISATATPVAVRVIRTDEELMIARSVCHIERATIKR
jgi:acetate kinase